MWVQADNTQQGKKEDLPKSFKDLLDPKWKGKLAIEAEDQEWLATIVQEMGEEQGLKFFRELARFIDCHKAALAPKRDEFTAIVRDGPGRWLERGLERVDALDPKAAGALKATPANATRALGMCGMLEQLQTFDAA